MQIISNVSPNPLPQSQASRECAASFSQKKLFDYKVIRAAKTLFVDKPVITGVIVTAICLGAVVVASVVSYPLIPIVGVVALVILFGAGLCARPWLARNALLAEINAKGSALNTLYSELESLKDVGTCEERLKLWKSYAILDDVTTTNTRIEEFLNVLPDYIKACRTHKAFVEQNRAQFEEIRKNIDAAVRELETVEKTILPKGATLSRDVLNDLKKELTQEGIFLTNIIAGKTDEGDESLYKPDDQKIVKLFSANVERAVTVASTLASAYKSVFRKGSSQVDF